MVKQGYVRTLEAFMAMLVTFMFILLVTPASNHSDSTQKMQILNLYKDDTDYRLKLASLDGCIDKSNTTIELDMPSYYGYYLCDDTVPELPKGKVYVDSVLIYEGDYKEIRLYHWIE